MRSKRKVSMDAFLTAILVSILWRYIYLAELRKTEEQEPLRGIKRRQG